MTFFYVLITFLFMNTYICFSRKSKDEVIFNKRRVDVGTIMNDTLLNVLLNLPMLVLMI